jgi:hypothetical protein
MGLSLAWPVAEAIARPARRYAQAIGIEQDWRMFANPPLSNSRLVARCELAANDGSQVTWDARQLLPGPTGRGFGLQALLQSAQDKAVDNAMTAFEDAARERPGEEGATRLGADPLGPVSRWAAAGAVRADGGRRVVRTELWGTHIPIAPPATQSPMSESVWRLVDSR